MSNQQLSTNTFTTAKWIVSANASQGTHTTIASALTSASSGDTIFIFPGSYTENLTLKAGVDIVTYGGQSSTPNVTIIGKLSATFTGSCSITGIRLQTNSDNILAVTGSSATIVNLYNCYINATNNTAISFTSSSGGSQINLFSCNGDLGTTGIAYFSMSANGQLNINNGVLANSGNSTTASTNSSASGGAIGIRNGFFNNAITTSNGAAFIAFSNEFKQPIILNGTSSNVIGESSLEGSTSSALSIGSGAIATVLNSNISSSNTNAITGAGTLIYSGLAFNSVSTINTTTLTALIFQPGITRSAQQPCFLAFLSAGGTGAAQGTIPFDTVVFDQNSNFTTGAGAKFTAPYTGKYFFTANATINNVAGTGDIVLSLVATSRTIKGFFPAEPAATSAINTASISGVLDMTAGDTCTVTVTSNVSPVTIVGSASPYQTSFSGYLIC